MNKTILSAAGAGLALSLIASAAEARSLDCSSAISATGRSTHVEGSDDYTTYHGHLPPHLAESRAIASWRNKVMGHCQASSTKWWRATAKNIDCEGAAGHTYCTVTATPAKKWFVW